MARLFVIPARNAPTALILRRGPSDWSHLILWDTSYDSFTHGAWYKGRIYEEKCDLSPDGKLFLYFARKDRYVDPGYKASYTALSRAPWLYALGLWLQGTTYGGGGRFLANRKIVLTGVIHELHPNHPLQGVEVTRGRAEPRQSSGEVPEADWCGRDHRFRIIYTVGTKVFRRVGSKDIEIADFDGLRPDPQPAPEWAQQPITRRE